MTHFGPLRTLRDVRNFLDTIQPGRKLRPQAYIRLFQTAQIGTTKSLPQRLRNRRRLAQFLLVMF